MFNVVKLDALITVAFPNGLIMMAFQDAFTMEAYLNSIAAASLVTAHIL